MQKQEKILLEGHRSSSLHQKHKSAICDRTSPHLHIKPSLYVCKRVEGSQIFKQNWIISIRSRVIVILLIWVSSALGGGTGGWGCLGWSSIVYMSSGMFRGKESSNRIELSQLVQDLLNFGVSGSLWLWGWGVSPTHMHMHAHAHMCKHAHACVVNMIISCKWPPPLGEYLGIPYDVICTCMCVCAHACMPVHVGGVHPLTTPHPHPPTPHPLRGDLQNQSKFNSTWTNRDISILFEDLKSVETPPPMCGCIILWVGGWVDGWGQVKSLKIWKLLTESR